MPDLTPPQIAALDAITAHHNLWPEWTALETVHGADTLTELVNLGLIVRWERPNGASAVLTPVAMAQSRRVPEEHWEYVHVIEKQSQGPGKRDQAVRVRKAVATPKCERGELVENGDELVLEPRKRLVKMETGMVDKEKPVKPPIYAAETILDFPAPAPPPPPYKGPEYVADIATGETTRDPSQVPLSGRLFVSDARPEGIPMIVDPRLKRQRIVNAARKAIKGQSAKPKSGKPTPPKPVPDMLTGRPDGPLSGIGEVLAKDMAADDAGKPTKGKRKAKAAGKGKRRT